MLARVDCKTQGDWLAKCSEAVRTQGCCIVEGVLALAGSRRSAGQGADEYWLRLIGSAQELSWAVRDDSLIPPYYFEPDTERTLRTCCREVLGVGPLRYLWLRRMHLARQALLHADASVSTVTEVATAHGFWELGRFSVEYRTLFGESPSESLRRGGFSAA